jgi:hypothetical protein
MLLPISHRTKVLLYVSIVSAFFAFAPGARDAGAQECDINVNKVANVEDGTVFTIIVETQFGTSEIDLLAGEGFGQSSATTNINTITEDVPPGWVLSDVVCDEVDGIIITRVPNGFRSECTVPTGVAQTTCTFINVQGSASNIPTLSEWGMIAAAAGLGLVGVYFAVRRRRAIKI